MGAFWLYSTARNSPKSVVILMCEFCVDNPLVSAKLALFNRQSRDNNTAIFIVRNFLAPFWIAFTATQLRDYESEYDPNDNRANTIEKKCLIAVVFKALIVSFIDIKSSLEKLMFLH